MLGALLGAAGSIGSALLGNSAASKQAKLQKQFAKNAIQWKVADAEKAGIHPLYALGANTVSYSPVSVGTPDLGAMGQDIGQAIDRVANPSEKAGGALAALTLERAGLENDLLRAQIARARINVAGMVPGPANVLAPTTKSPLTEDGNWVVGNPDAGQAIENAYQEAGLPISALFLLRDFLTNAKNRYYKGPSDRLRPYAYSKGSAIVGGDQP